MDIRSYSCKVNIECGIYGKKLVVFLKSKDINEGIKYLDDPGDEISNHVMVHWFNGEIKDKNNVIELVLNKKSNHILPEKYRPIEGTTTKIPDI